MAIKTTELGKILAIVKIEKELSHSDLSNILGIDDSTLSLILKGERTLSMSKIGKIYEVCGDFIAEQRIESAIIEASIGQKLDLSAFSDESKIKIFKFAQSLL